jgi:hypothetical protein
MPSTPQTVALYVADRAARLASSTIVRRLASISKAYQVAGFPESPASTRLTLPARFSKARDAALAKVSASLYRGWF